MEALNQYQNEKRAIEYLTLGPAQAGDIPAPTPEVLDKYFEARKVLFRAPEYRKIALLSMSPATLAKPDAVTDADAKNYFEQHKANYGTPERRELRQIVFPKAEDAAAAKERIDKGTSFAAIAKERGLKDSDTDLGIVTKSDIIDPAVAEAAFALKSGEVSAPVKGRFGTVLVEVGKIEPGSQKTFDQVEPQIKREIAENRAKNDIGNLRDKFEDERAAGSTLAEAAKKLGFTARTIEAVDRSGRGPDGKPIPDLPKSPDVVAAGFSSDVGVDNDPLQLPSGGYLWYDVAGITPARDRKLDEVKTEVETRWRDDEIAKRLKAKTDDMVDKLKAGATFDQLALDNGLKAVTATDLQRGKAGGFAPAKLVEAAFKTAKDVPGSAAGDQETTRFVFRVTDVTDPPLDPLTRKQVTGAAEFLCRRSRRSLCHAPGKGFRRHVQPAGARPGHRRRRPATIARPTSQSYADRAVAKRIRGNVRPRRAAGGVDDAGRRPRNAGLRLSQARRRQTDEFSSGVGRRRRRARPPFHHRHRARPDLAD